MSDHNCPGLIACNVHPKWKVMRILLEGRQWVWCVYPPRRNLNHAAEFPTHAEAITHAQKEATK